MIHTFKVGDKVRRREGSCLDSSFVQRHGNKDYYVITSLGGDKYVRFDGATGGWLARHFELYVDERKELEKAMDLFERHDLYRDANQYKVRPNWLVPHDAGPRRKDVLDLLFPTEKQTKLNELQKQIADLQKTANELEKEINE
jgi:hypothetical protein